jgi:hypothetical protein
MSWKFSSTKALVKLSCFSSKSLKNLQDSWCIINHQLLGEVWVCFFKGHLSCSILRDFTLGFRNFFSNVFFSLQWTACATTIFKKKKDLKKNCVVCVSPL